ncbi:MAG: hypothetical protein JXR37_30235 [Kiritimatiellae bacterium]|nr:hypothetical protein [Kiritimatiellia bacterium]
MAGFPRTRIENLSVPRLIAGTNWFLGYSHQTKARDRFIQAYQSRERLADILEVFMAAGCDAIYGVRPESPALNDAVKDAEDRTGRQCVRMGTPHLNLAGPIDADANKKTLDGFAKIGCHVCLPHQATTDVLLDRRSKTIRDMDAVAAMTRERGMIPGLSTHMPETIIYADATNLDVGTYIQIYNAAGFLMQVEIDWIHRIIWRAKKPVMTIKPLAAGRLPPLVGLSFSWATLRPQDMIIVGCLTPDEAREVIDISVAQLEGKGPAGELQKTRSKMSLEYTND